MSSDKVKHYVVVLKNSLTYIRSIDGFLVKLGSIVYEVEDGCRDGSCDPVVIVRGILTDEELRDILSNFSCYRGEIYSSIEKDPRHKILRRYLNVIREAMDQIPCIEKRELEVLTPSPTWWKEREEHRVVVHEETRALPSLKPKSRLREFEPESLIYKLLVIGLAIFIITLILLFLT